MPECEVLIVGGGLAAQRAAETLRARDHRGPIRVVCGEPVAPYDRPPLSKELRAEPFRPPDVVRARTTSSCCSAAAPRGSTSPAGACARGRRRARLRRADRRHRRPPAAAADVRRAPERARAAHAGRRRRRCARRSCPGARLAIVGAGFVGQEVAATARGLGAEVTLIEAADVPLAHVLGPRLGGWFADLHRAEGVRVELGVSVADARPAVAGAPVARARPRRRPDDRRRRGARRRRRRARDALARRARRWPARRRGRRRRPHRRPARLRRRRRHRRPALGARGAARRRRRALDPRPAGRAGAARERLERPVRRPHPPRRRGRARASRSTAGPRRATSPRCCAATASLTGALLVGRPRELPRWRRRLAQPHEERSAA